VARGRRLPGRQRLRAVSRAWPWRCAKEWGRQPPDRRLCERLDRFMSRMPTTFSAKSYAGLPVAEIQGPVPLQRSSRGSPLVQGMLDSLAEVRGLAIRSDHVGHERPVCGPWRKKLGIGSYRRHVLLCTGPSCCTPRRGGWQPGKPSRARSSSTALGTGEKRLLPDQGGLPADLHPRPDRRWSTRKGTWYHGLTAEKMPRFVKEHLSRGGRPIEEWVFARNPLGEESESK